MKKAVEEGTVMEKKIPELLINCKNAVAMTAPSRHTAE